jgi:DNA-binding LacI/PurR family transcriptional regulator
MCFKPIYKIVKFRALNMFVFLHQAELKTQTIDNYRAAYEMTSYLILHVRKKIGFINGCTRENTTAERINGHTKALEGHNECINLFLYL